MIVVRVIYQIKANERDEFLQKVEEKKIRKLLSEQPGNIDFRFAVPVDNDSQVELIDSWENEKSFWAHVFCEPNQKLFLPLIEKYAEDQKNIFYDAEQDEHFIDRMQKFA